MFRRRRITVSVAAVLVLLGAYTGIVAAAPLPQLPVSMSVTPTVQFDADASPAQAAVDAQSRPTAVTWLGTEQIWSNSEDSHRIASLTKLITALVGLEAAPIEPGTDGPIYTLTYDDSLILDEIIAEGGSFAPAPIGLELTTRQILDLILVPSANNYATTYARAVFGSDEAFLAAANDWLTRNNLTSVRIFDATGMNDDNSATPADMARLTRIALEHLLIAEIVAQSVINVPELGEITTTNRLLGEPGVLGVKTGTTFPEGYSLAAAQQVSDSGRDLVAIVVVMDRADADARATDARETLTGLASAWQTVPLVEARERIGSVTTWEGESVSLVAKQGADTVLIPGEQATRTVELGSVAEGKAGSEAGAIRLATPLGGSEIEVVTAETIEAPGLWWRFTHPAILFGWQPIEAN